MVKFFSAFLMIGSLAACGQFHSKRNNYTVNNVPKSAFKFKKYWINVDHVNSHRNRAHITFYSIATGKILKSHTYSMACVIDGRKPIFIEGLEAQIAGLDGDDILVKQPSDNDKCWLKRVD